MNQKKSRFLILSATLVAINFFTFWRDGTYLRYQRGIPHGKVPHTGGQPVILIWIAPTHNSSWKLPMNELCGEGCNLTNDRKLLSASDAVVFYMKGVEYDKKLLPRKRYQHQLFTWWCHESPFTTSQFYRRTLAYPANYFNYTMTYNTNSDVVAAMIPVAAQNWYLHKIGRGDEAHEKQLKSFTSKEEFEDMFAKLMKMKSRDKLAAWIASDCQHIKGAVRRVKFVNSLQLVGELKLDKFGKCGEFNLSKDHDVMFSTIQSYKFFLAFENARNCSGYITEKFWYNSLYAGAVPVVDGSSRGEYERVAPPNSFIHVDDFDRDPIKIADYLRKVASNDEKYKEYFKWWMMPGFYPIYNLREPEDEETGIQNVEQDYEVGGFCHLCRILKERKKGTKITYNAVEDLADFYYEPETSLCTNQ